MLIRNAAYRDIALIHKLAHEIWWPTYRNVISDEQISFMLDDMYSESAVKQQMEEGISFLIAERDSAAVGFAGCQLTKPDIFKLHKLYLLPSEQGKGTGKLLVEHVSKLAKGQGAEILELNVNRANPALGFYEKLGFETHQTVDIPYHHFELNDYVMRKAL